MLLVRPNGSKLLQLRFSHKGKEKTASFGQFTDVSLSDARVKRDEKRKQVAAGSDPVAIKREARQAKTFANENNFEAVAREWWEHWRAGRTSTSHVEQTMRRLISDVFPMIGTLSMVEIESPEMFEMALAIESRGATDLTKRSLQTCSQIFRYAIAYGKAHRNPFADLEPSEILKARKSIFYFVSVFSSVTQRRVTLHDSHFRHQPQKIFSGSLGCHSDQIHQYPR